ncbi:Methyltransferase domain-containing protein [Quadrisphaera sp. DSM 44207]|nr:Methyltransferase domain-containing protein [Quadrisphaera sp. DSM 44207]
MLPSPNAWYHPEVYELEDRVVDPDGAVGAAVRSLLGPRGWEGLRVLDVGCGAGAGLARFATGPGAAARVVGVEPHPPLLEAARRRAAGLPGAGAVAGTAQRLPLPDASVDLAHARWAYFFGPGCEPGLAELARVVRPGGLSVVVDTDATRSTFGAWFRRAVPRHDPVAVERFWRRQGWRREQLLVRWAAPDRAAFEAVVRIEPPPAAADAALAEHPGTELDHALVLRWRRS